jgi:gentisate 1,2-dioxygenase
MQVSHLRPSKRRIPKAKLWKVLRGLVPQEPKTGCKATYWSFEEVRPFLIEATELITAKEAERRVLVLENSGLRGQSRITNTLFGGLQVILPGEVAPAHRHAQSALRFVLEGEGAFTAVNGEKIPMNRGDVIITPSWFWHDHGKTAPGPMIWFDCLDIPVVNFFEAQFAEMMDAEQQPVTVDEGVGRAKFGSGLMPIEHEPESATSPLHSYPYSESRAALQTLRDAGNPDPWHGHKLRYTNPVTGGHITPTMAAFLQLLPKGLKTKPYRCTGGTVFVVAEGQGQTRIGEETFTWGPNDAFVVPSWAPHHHEAAADSVLFSYSDRGILESLDLWREDKMTD